MKMAKKEVNSKVYSQRMKYLIFFSNHNKLDLIRQFLSSQKGSSLVLDQI
jgi:hypothetical protein